MPTPAREYWSQVSQAVAARPRALREYEAAKARLYRVGGPSQPGAPRSKGPRPDLMPEHVDAMDRARRRYADSLRAAEEAEDEARGVIAALEDAEPMATALWGDVLTYRYLLGMTWRQVADAAGVSVRWAAQVRDLACDMMDRHGLIPR